MSEANVTFKDKYNECKTWQDKAICIALYHSIMSSRYPTWNLNDTALHFGVSIGLVSENIRLAKAIDDGNIRILKSKTREEGLKLIERRHYVRDRTEITIWKVTKK